MTRKPYSIIGFDDPKVMDSLGTKDRKEIEEIFELFQKKDLIKSLLLTYNNEESYNFINTQPQGRDIPTQQDTYQDIFDKEHECNFTNSIIKNHSILLSTQNDYKKTEIMNSIIQEILITVQMFSEENISFDLTMLQYIKYIINTIISKLRKDPYLSTDENEFDEELTDISHYFSEIGQSIDKIILDVNNDKVKEDRILGDANNITELEEIFMRKQSYCSKRYLIQKHYEMCIPQYTILLKSLIVSGNEYLPGLYQKLYDLIFTKFALDVIDEFDDTQE